MASKSIDEHKIRNYESNLIQKQYIFLNPL